MKRNTFQKAKNTFQKAVDLRPLEINYDEWWLVVWISEATIANKGDEPATEFIENVARHISYKTPIGILLAVNEV